MPLSPLDILYIVLAFCALWVAAATFWLIFQIASVVKNFNDLLAEVQDKVERIEGAISGIRHKFESMGGSMTALVIGIEKVIGYAIEKRRAKKDSSQE
jgi:hypothetical protein